jgi:hypothetical protein
MTDAKNLIVSAFTHLWQFDEVLAEIGIQRQAEIEGTVIRQVVLNAVQQGEAAGWLPFLIAGVARARPLRTDIQTMYQQYAASLITDAKRQEIYGRIKEAYASFGLAPPVSVQQSGGADVTVIDSGLERTIREELGYVEVSVWRDKLFRLEGRVCRVELNDAGVTMGTGFLVGAETLLTNYHVLEKVIEGNGASAVRFHFDYKVLPRGGVSDGMSCGLKSPNNREVWLLGHGTYSAVEKEGTPDVAPPRAGELDYALVRLDAPVGTTPAGTGGPTRGWVEVPAAQPDFARITTLLILQHPRAEPLKLAFDTRPNVELKHNGLRVRYATNTEGGSSGSPCFDKDWKLIALHHYGDPALNHPKYNQGIPIGLIRRHLSEEARAMLGGPCD